MSVEDFLFSAGGGFLFGAVAGYAIKKVMKIAAVVIGLFVAALAYLSYRGWVDVKWAAMENASRGTLTNASEQVVHALSNTATQFASHPSAVAASGLPIATTFGFVPGLMMGVEDRMNSLATLGISALLVIVILTPQSASANNIGGFDCYGQTDCVNGWNAAIGQATQDYNFNPGYNFYVYHWQEYCLPYHSYDYCSGYWHSYNYEWNNIAQQQNQQCNQQSNQQINIYNYGNGNTFNTGQGTSQGSDQGP